MRLWRWLNIKFPPRRDSQTNGVMLENDEQLQTPVDAMFSLLRGQIMRKEDRKNHYPFKWRSLHTVFGEPSFQRQSQSFLTGHVENDLMHMFCLTLFLFSLSFSFIFPLSNQPKSNENHKKAIACNYSPNSIQSNSCWFFFLFSYGIALNHTVR